MKLPAKDIYACKAVLELAIRYKPDMPVQINNISQAQGIPKKFLNQLLLRLKNANIVNSARGMAGGYFLARSPSDISLVDVFSAVDDSFIRAVEKPVEGKSNEFDRLIISIWGGINKDIRKHLADIKLDQLLSRVKKEAITYMI